MKEDVLVLLVLLDGSSNNQPTVEAPKYQAKISGVSRVLVVAYLSSVHAS